MVTSAMLSVVGGPSAFVVGRGQHLRIRTYFLRVSLISCCLCGCMSFREKPFNKWASTVCSVLETFAEAFSLVATEGCSWLSVNNRIRALNGRL